MFNLSGAELIYLFSAFHGVFLSTVLVSGRRIKVNLYLALLILLFSFYLVENVVYSSGYLRVYPHFFLTTFPLVFLIGPLFYFYIKSNVQPGFPWKLGHLIHLVPFAFEILILLPFYALDSSMKVRIYEATLSNTNRFEFNIFFAGYLIYLGTACWYFLSSFKLLSSSDPQRNQRSKIKHYWLRLFSMALFSYILLSSLLTVLTIIDAGFQKYSFHINLILQTLLIHSAGYIAFIYPEIFKEGYDVSVKKYQSSTLDKEVLSALKANLINVMDQQKPYLDCDLTPDYFASKLEISKHQLSQLLTEGMQTTFYDFVNKYRVEKAKQLMSLPEYSDAKILHIAYDSGFSNKSSFLRHFKKMTGLTPTEYRINTINKVPLH